MKGINIQFDNLVTLIERNTSNKETVKNRDSFDLVYQKITLEALKTVGLIFDNILEDFAIKNSFARLTKQLKSFLSLKPLTQQQDQDDFFNNQFDQVKQFMNNRKPVIAEVDTSQRGDIVKFLFQAENKQKDIQEFMGNMNKFSAIKEGGRRFKTANKLPLVTEDIDVQTILDIEYFEKLEKKMPGLFRIDNLIAKSAGLKGTGQNADGSSNNDGSNPDHDLFDIEAQIQQLVLQKMQQEAAKAAQAAQQAASKQKQKSKLQAQQQKKKKSQQQAQSNKRNSSNNNPKRSSMQVTSHKTKGSLGGQKKSMVVIEEQKGEEGKQKHQNVNVTNSGESLRKTGGINGYGNGNSQLSQSRYKSGNYKEFIPTIQQLQQLHNSIPSFEQIFQTLSSQQGFQNISQQQLKLIYQTIKTSTTQSLLKSQLFAKPQTDHKQSNTNMTFGVEGFVDQMGQVIDWDTYYEESGFGGGDGKKAKGKKGSKGKRRGQKSRESPDGGIDEQDEEGQGDHDYLDSKEKRLKSNTGKGDRKDELNRSTPNDLLMQQDETNQLNKSSSNGQEENSLSQNQTATKSGFPNISNQTDGENRQQKSTAGSMLLKEGRSAEQFLKKFRDTKYTKPLHQSKSVNKQNYTLDMYKSKQELKNNNRSSEHVNLPSLSRNNNSTSIKNGQSLHENLLEAGKSPYLNRASRNLKFCSSSDQLFLPDASQNSSKKSHNKPLNKQMSKQEQRIMKQLQRIGKQGAAKNNIKHIAMYIQFIESVHVRKCGQKCIHLERFYQFLQKNNLPNRRELLLHKADMNVSVQL